MYDAYYGAANRLMSGMDGWMDAVDVVVVPSACRRIISEGYMAILATQRVELDIM